MSEPDEFERCRPSLDGVCRLEHLHELHGGLMSWPIHPRYERMRERFALMPRRDRQRLVFR